MRVQKALYNIPRPEIRRRINYQSSICSERQGRCLVMKSDEEEDNLEKITKLDVSLDGKDYLALTIAALETIFLPLIILVVVILIVVLLLR